MLRPGNDLGKAVNPVSGFPFFAALGGHFEFAFNSFEMLRAISRSLFCYDSSGRCFECCTAYLVFYESSMK